MKQEYCVYKHINSEGVVFYIGAGKIYRPKTKTRRSKAWLDYVAENEFQWEIIEYHTTLQEAYEREKFWISHYGRKDLDQGELINRTDGGLGTKGLKRPGETKRVNQEVYDFYTNTITTIMELRKNSDKASNYFYRVALGKQYKNPRYLYLDLIPETELKRLLIFHSRCADTLEKLNNIKKDKK